MHVGFALLTLLPGKVGGSETYVRSLLDGLASERVPDRVTVLAAESLLGSLAGIDSGQVAVRAVAGWRYPHRTAGRALAIGGGLLAGRALARRQTSDLDVVHYPLTTPLPKVSVPTVVTYHDALHLDHPAFFSAAERTYRTLAYDRAARKASIVVTPSEFTRDTLSKRLGIARERVAVCGHGVDRSRFTPDRSADDRLLAGLRLPERYLIYPANHWPHKNHERLIEALGLTAGRDLHVVLTGGLHERGEALSRTARRAGVGSRVTHLGFVSASALAALYRRARGMIFPSLYEGFGSPPLEAMACGCPTAVSHVAALPQVCGDATLYFDPRSAASIAQAIDRLDSDHDLREQLRELGLSRAARFTWSASAQRHAAVYRRACGLREPGRQALSSVTFDSGEEQPHSP